MVVFTTHLSQTILVILEAFYSVQPFLKSYRYGVVVEWLTHLTHLTADHDYIRFRSILNTL